MLFLNQHKPFANKTLYNFKYHVLKLLKIRWDWICHDLWQGLFLLNGTCIFFYPQAFGILEKRRTKVNDKVWMNNILIVILYFIVLFLWPQTSCESWIRFHEQSSIYASYRQEILLITFNFPYTYLIIQRICSIHRKLTTWYWFHYIHVVF